MELVLVLNEMFQLFDKAAEKHCIKKIKTLGDCYVASSGILEVTSDHASNLISFGLQMHDEMVVLQEIPDLLSTFSKLKNQNCKENRLRIRVGINSGAVVGGVVGDKKAQFDVWGDTVEIANFMESEGVTERVCEHFNLENYNFFSILIMLLANILILLRYSFFLYNLFRYILVMQLI